MTSADESKPPDSSKVEAEKSASTAAPVAIAVQPPVTPSPYVVADPAIVIPVSGVPNLRVLQQIQTTSWQGPFPHPEAVEQYEKLLPGVFNRLVTMAEEAQTAQIKSLERAQEFTRRDIRRGHWLGWSTIVLAMTCCMVCVYLKQPWVASLFLTVPVMAAAKSFYDSRQTSKPDESKSQSGSSNQT